MHELSIALSMIEQIEEETARHGGSAVETIYVRLGVLSGVDGEALRFAYEVAAEGTPLAAARLEIEAVALLVRCPQCGESHRPPPHNILCPRCVWPEQEILEGRELEVRALELTA